MIESRRVRADGRPLGGLSGAIAQVAGVLTLVGVLAAAPAGAEAVLLVPVGPGADLAVAFDLVAASRARALTAGPVAGTLVATNTPRLRSKGPGAGFLVIGWTGRACDARP